MTYDFKLADIVKTGTCHFHCYRQGYLYYRVSSSRTDIADHLFTINISDCDKATFDSTLPAITLLRYIRKAMNDGSLVPL